MKTIPEVRDKLQALIVAAETRDPATAQRARDLLTDIEAIRDVSYLAGLKDRTTHV